MSGRAVGSLGTVLAVVGASVLSSLITAFVAVEPARSQVLPTPSILSEHLEERLARIEQKLDRVRTVAASPVLAAERLAWRPREEQDRAPAGERLESLLDRFEAELDDRGVRVLLPVHGAEPLPREVVRNLAAISAIAALHTEVPQEARREIVLMTPREVIERFGSPSRVESTNMDNYDMWWSYDEPFKGALQILFGGGYALYSESNRP